jgi:MFS family permease
MQSPDAMRGRVMAAYNLVFVGSTPIGALYAGKISDALGASMGFLVSGAIGLVFLAAMLILVTPRTFKGLRTFAMPCGPAQNGAQMVGSSVVDVNAPVGASKD